MGVVAKGPAGEPLRKACPCEGSASYGRIKPNRTYSPPVAHEGRPYVDRRWALG